VKGLPAVTVSQGKVVWKDGDLRITPGAGRKIERKPRPEVFAAQEKVNEITRPRGVRRQVHLHQGP
jgi:dihydropyrimidinase